MIEVQPRDPDLKPEWITAVREAGETSLKHEKQLQDAGVTIVLSDDAEIQSLNNQFLGIDAPTDVLSFPAGETDPDSGTLYLGDIIISLPRAVEQAERGNHPIEAELQLLVVHGILHLLGFDHAEDMDKQRMWQVQAEILGALGSPIRYPADTI